MSWSLTASGHASPEQEQELAAALGNLLADPEAGTGGASFTCSTFAGDPRVLAAGEQHAQSLRQTLASWANQLVISAA